MSSYVCASIDAAGNCAEWVQTWNVAALSVSDAASLSSIIVGCWSLAYGLRLITRFILNRL